MKKIEAAPGYIIFFDNIKVDSFVKSFSSTVSNDGSVNRASIEMIYLPELDVLSVLDTDGSYTNINSIDDMTDIKIFVKNVFNNKYSMVFDGNIRSKNVAKSPNGNSLSYGAIDHMDSYGKTTAPLALPLEDRILASPTAFQLEAQAIDLDKIDNLPDQGSTMFKGKTIAEAWDIIRKQAMDSNKVYSDPTGVMSWNGLAQRFRLMGDITSDTMYREVMDLKIDPTELSADNMYVLINGIVQKLMFEFYQDRDGAIRVKPPFWNEAVLIDHIIDESIILGSGESTMWESGISRIICSGGSEQTDPTDTASQNIFVPMGAYVGDTYQGGRWSTVADASQDIRDVLLAPSVDEKKYGIRVYDTSQPLIKFANADAYGGGTAPVPDDTSVPQATRTTTSPDASTFGDPYSISIMGDAQATAGMMSDYLLGINPLAKNGLGYTTLDLANTYIREGVAEGVRGDLAFAQACEETGNFTSSWCKAPKYNFAGLGVTGEAGKGGIFNTMSNGVRAHIQVLKQFATTQPLNNPMVYKSGRQGTCPYLYQLSGQWAYPGYPTSFSCMADAYAKGQTYGQLILFILKNIYDGPISGSTATANVSTDPPPAFNDAAYNVDTHGAYDALKAYCVFLYNMLNSVVNTCTTDLIGYPKLRPGMNCWFAPTSSNKIYYIASVTLNGDQQTGVFTNVKMIHGRDAKKFFSGDPNTFGSLKGNKDDIFVNSISSPPSTFGPVIDSLAKYNQTLSRAKDFHSISGDGIIKADKCPYLDSLYAGSGASDHGYNNFSDSSAASLCSGTGNVGAYLFSDDLTLQQIQTVLNHLYASAPSVVKSRAATLSKAIGLAQKDAYKYYINAAFK